MQKKSAKSPRIAKWIMRRVVHYDNRNAVLGDFEEAYTDILTKKGWLISRMWYWWQVMISIPPFICNTIYWSLTMLRSYLTIALRVIRLRVIRKEKVISAINITGFGTGMALCILLFFFIRSELNYDNFHKNKENIYRAMFSYKQETIRVTMAPFGPALLSDYPEIENMVRFWETNSVIKNKTDIFNDYVLIADPSFFEIFTFPLISGNSSVAMESPNSVIIGSDIAEKYFPGENPVGEQISIQLGDNFQDFLISGVADQIPENSSIQFSYIIPFQNISRIFGENIYNQWSVYDFNTFVLFNPESDPDEIIEKSAEFAQKYFSNLLIQDKGEPEDFRFILQNFADFHLGPYNGGNALIPTGSPGTIYIFSGIAFLILLIAGFNFMNLNLAQSSTRFKEIGTRKVLGAQRIQLAKQHLFEAVIMSIFSLIIGFALAQLFLPSFNNFTGGKLVLDYANNLQVTGGLICLAVLLGLVAGSYPALVVTRYQPVAIFKGTQKIGGKNLFAQSMITAQFSISIFLIIGALFISRQLELLQTKDLGFDIDNVVAVQIGSRSFSAGQTEQIYNQYKNKIAGFGSISGVTGTSTLPMRGSSITGIQFNNKQFEIYRYKVDYNFFETMGIELLHGRNFRENFPSDLTNSIVVNETFVRELGIVNPIGYVFEGKRISPVNNPEIIGIVSDFHFLHIEPAMMIMHPSRNINYAIVKLAPGNTSGTIDFLRESWSNINPDIPFNYFFVDDHINRLYINEDRWSRVSSYSSYFAIAIACLGLFGLVSIVVTQRRKEIGIRKVLGATSTGIIFLISKRFVVLLLTANIFAWPAAYLIVNRWLQSFAYKIPVGIEIFIFTSLITLFVALLTICLQSLKAAWSRPADSLRYE